MNEQELRERVGIAVESAVAPQLGSLFPAAAIAVRLVEDTLYSGAFGTVAPGQPTTPNTLFDLDSLTELYTTTAFLRLVEAGRLWIDTPVNVVLPDVHESVTFWHLLTHTSGLPASINLCRLPEYEMRIAAIESALLTRPAGETEQHSRLGYMLLGLAIEALTDLPLDQAIALTVLQPLDLASEYAPLSKLANVAPTSATLDREAFDSNARCLDGVAGHAGLFGTASDLARLTQLYVSRGRVGSVQMLSEAVTAEALKDQFNGRGLGWERVGTRFGHSSQTGVFVGADWELQLVIALATNSIHLSVYQDNVRDFFDGLFDQIATLIRDQA